MSSISSSFTTGRVSNIGTTGVQIFSGESSRSIVGIHLYCSTGNNGTIYIGNNSGVTADSADATDGYPLGADDSFKLPLRNPEEVWAIASNGTQKLWFMVV